MQFLAFVVSVTVVVTNLGGCANTGANYRPLADLQGRSEAQYQNDLHQCQDYASKVSGAGETAAIGAVAGALLGAAISSLFGGDRHSRNDASLYGALLGAGSGGASAEDEQRTIIRRCLSGRGYNVLN
jgi:outer membrane lipoprotein SlyB